MWRMFAVAIPLNVIVRSFLHNFVTPTPSHPRVLGHADACISTLVPLYVIGMVFTDRGTCDQ